MPRTITFPFTYSLLMAGLEVCDIECQAVVSFEAHDDYEIEAITVSAWSKAQAKHVPIPLADDFIFAAQIKAQAEDEAPSAISEYRGSADDVWSSALERAQIAADRREGAA